MEISLTLSGGALRVSAQVGVLRFLEEQRVKIKAVSGSSAGAILAVLLANGLNSYEIEEFLLSTRRRDLFNFKFKNGLFSLDRVEQRLRESFGKIEHSNLKIPCFISVTRLSDAKSIYLNSGDAISNALASSSLTPIFTPREINGVSYIDGGFSDNLPVKPLKDYPYPNLSINVNPLEGELPTNFSSLFMRSLAIMLNSSIRPSIPISSAYIEIKGLANMHLFEFSSRDRAIKSGYEEIRDRWSTIKEALKI